MITLCRIQLFLLFTGIYPYTGRSAFAQDTTIFSLRDCIEYALKNSYELKEDQLNSKENTMQFKQQATRFYPQIDGTVKYYNYITDLPTYIFPESEGAVLSEGSSGEFYPVELGLPYNLEGGIKVSQVLFNLNFFLSDDFKNTLKLSENLKSQMTREEIIYNVAVNFYKTGALQEKRDLIEFNRQRIDRIESTLESQIENGYARDMDRGKLQISRSKIDNESNQLEAGISRLTNYLKFLMGMPMDQALIIKKEKIEVSQSIPEQNPEDTAANTKLELLKVNADMNDLQKRKIRADYGPELDAYAYFTAQAQRNALNFFQTGEDWYLINIFGLSVNIPIMHGGDKKRKLDLMEINSDRIELNRIKLRENLEMQYQNARNELMKSIHKVQNEEKNVQIAVNIFRNIESLYNSGVASLKEMLDAEAGYREALTDQISAKYDYKIAELYYLKTTGNLLHLDD